MSNSRRSADRPKNAFEFVTVASARAHQLLRGCTPKVEGSAKPARRAVQEVAQGTVSRAEPQDAETPPRWGAQPAD
jgi:DNA-directed RNA polymerase subunit K/omega